MIRLPEEQHRLAELRSAGSPRLLLLAPEQAPPVSTDHLEDWVRLPAATRDVRARVATLAGRIGGGHAPPRIDDEGILRFRGNWAPLSPVESLLATALLDRFGAVVGRDALARRVWPRGAPTRNALDVHVLRLRRRIAPLGLEVRTVRARGYLLQGAAAAAS